MKTKIGGGIFIIFKKFFQISIFYKKLPKKKLVKIEFIAVVEDRRNEFKLILGVDNSPNQYNNPMGYKLGLGLAERKGFEPSIPR